MDDFELLRGFTDDAARLLLAACDLQGMAQEAREVCREEYRKKESNEHNILRIAIDGQIALLAERISRPVKHTDERISYQIGVLVSYTRSHYLINDLIMGGDVVEALTILRRQVESLARLNELDAHPLKELLKKTPNVRKALTKETGNLYGFLSEVAHSSTPRSADLLTIITEGNRVGPSLMPRYSDHVPAAFELHWFFALIFLAWITAKLPEWYPAIDHTDDRRRFVAAVQLAQKVKFIQFPDSGDFLPGE